PDDRVGRSRRSSGGEAVSAPSRAAGGGTGDRAVRGFPKSREGVVLLAGLLLIVGVTGYLKLRPGGPEAKDYVGRWVARDEVIELREGGTLGEVRLDGYFCLKESAASGDPLGEYRGSWKIGSVDDAGSGVFVTLRNYSRGQDCQIYLQEERNGQVTALGARPRGNVDRTFVRA
ncbi:hypothetical protein ACFU6K_38955, partial [Kitasatospora sp. NPDC057512]|uniref:hypothetical protein n=1 Tax=Kitasatospora sp. NPDC057512 TaxID=3346154 RepID=UPI003686C866